MTLAFADIPGAFDAGAPAYDKLVATNPGYHAHLKLSAQRMALAGDGVGLRLKQERRMSRGAKSL